MPYKINRIIVCNVDNGCVYHTTLDDVSRIQFSNFAKILVELSKYWAMNVDALTKWRTADRPQKHSLWDLWDS